MEKKANEKKTKNVSKKSNTKSETKNKKEKLKTEKNNAFKTTEVVFLLIITCVVSLIIGYSLNGNKKIKVKNKYSNDEQLQEFIKTYQYVLKNYYGETDSKTLLDGATAGMLSKLGDDFSTIIPDEYSNNFNIRLQGTYEGIGVEIINDEDDNVVIYGIFENSPAARSNLKIGDIIIKVDGKDFKKKKTSEVSKYILNSNKDTFEITVLRDGEEKTLKLQRDRITLKSVESKYIEKENKKIGYIYISIFSQETYKQFKKELKKLENKKIDSLVLDVRDNTGGHLTTVSDMLSLFFDNKHVIYQTKTKQQTKKFYSTGKKNKKYKIIVLQNENSASAAELFSITLKEEYRATVIGTKSFGKGTVQELVRTLSGSEYKFTTKEWLSPNGTSINKKGVEPTINVKLSDEYLENPIDENDNQYNSAIEEAIKG